MNDQILHRNIKNPGTAVELSKLTTEDLQKSTFKLLFCSAEDAFRREFTEELKSSSDLHERLSLIVVDEMHTVETWSGRR